MRREDCPCLDRIIVRALDRGCECPFPEVVPEIRHADLAPAGIFFVPEKQRGADHVAPADEDVRRNE